MEFLKEKKTSLVLKSYKVFFCDEDVGVKEISTGYGQCSHAIIRAFKTDSFVQPSACRVLASFYHPPLLKCFVHTIAVSVTGSKTTYMQLGNHPGYHLVANYRGNELFSFEDVWVRRLNASFRVIFI